jgi:hypothetical protein
MTDPVNRKTEARKRTNAEGSAQGAEGTPTPRQRAVLERYLKRRDSRPDAPRLIVKSKPNQPLAISQPSSADGAGFGLAFGTTEAGVASILLDSLINAACDGTWRRRGTGMGRAKCSNLAIAQNRVLMV